jgi:hypothetical protein
MTGAKVDGDRLQTLASVYYDYGLEALQNSALSDLAESPEFLQMLRAYAARWGQRRMNLPSSEDLRSSLQRGGLHILSDYSSPRRHRNVGGAALVDSTSTIVAGHPS